MNRFKDKRKRDTYDAYVKNYIAGTYLFHSGQEYRGSSDRNTFWAGFHGWWDSRIDNDFRRNSISYPIYRAGQDCAKGKAK